MPSKTKVYFKDNEECEKLKIDNPVLYNQICVKGHKSKQVLIPSKPKPKPKPPPPKPPVPPKPKPTPVEPDIPIPQPPLKPPDKPFVLPKGQPVIPFITEDVIQNKDAISAASGVGIAGMAAAVRARRVAQIANAGYDYQRLSSMEQGLEMGEIAEELPPIEFEQPATEIGVDILDTLVIRQRQLEAARAARVTGAVLEEPVQILEDVALLEEGGYSSSVATALTRAGIRLRRIGTGFNVARGAADVVETGIELEEISTGLATARTVATGLEAGEVAAGGSGALASAGMTVLTGAVAFGITEAGLRVAELILKQPKPGIVKVDGNIKDKLLEELNKNPDLNKKAIDEINTGEDYFITTTEERDADGNLKTILVKRLSGSDYAEAVDTATKFPEAYKGVDPYILQAMGLSRELSTKSADELDNLYAEDLGNLGSRRYFKGEVDLYNKQQDLNEKYMDAAEQQMLDGRRTAEINQLENELDKYHHMAEAAKHELTEQHEGFMTDVTDKKLRGEYQSNYNKQMDKLNKINPPEYTELGQQQITKPTGEVVTAEVVAY